ncbi:hypothetical protein ACIQVO_38730 [Streptomyces sp. NPDC101062]|uniref:hypothetical protein n=1 Tax=unclassified Streptomyces TaxID=2593676 RepID=UPI00380B5D5A
MAVAAAQAGHLAAAKADPAMQQDDQSVPGVAALQEHRHQFVVGGPVGIRFRLLFPVTGTQPVRQP